MATLQLVFHTCVCSNELYTKTNVHLTQSSNGVSKASKRNSHTLGVSSLVFTLVHIWVPIFITQI